MKITFRDVVKIYSVFKEGEVPFDLRNIIVTVNQHKTETGLFGADSCSLRNLFKVVACVLFKKYCYYYDCNTMFKDCECFLKIDVYHNSISLKCEINMPSYNNYYNESTTNTYNSIILNCQITEDARSLVNEMIYCITRCVNSLIDDDDNSPVVIEAYSEIMDRIEKGISIGMTIVIDYMDCTIHNKDNDTVIDSKKYSTLDWNDICDAILGEDYDKPNSKICKLVIKGPSKIEIYTEKD